MNWHDVSVRFEPGKQVGNAGEVLIGIGSREGSEGLVLARRLGGPSCASVSQYTQELIGRPDGIASCRAALPNGIESATVFMEDLSFDSCLSLYLLNAALHDIPRDDATANRWVDAANAWEAGLAPRYAPEHSTVCLHTALAHAHFKQKELAVSGKPADQPHFANGFVRCMEFLESAFLVGNLRIGDGSPVMHLEIARIAVDGDYLRYKEVIGRAKRFQLLLPTAGAPTSTPVDAIIVNEDAEFSGLMKIFLRSDVENSYYKRGFSIFAFHREGVSGTGYDMTVSVDPKTGVHLADLWARLELLEDAAWQGERPHRHPRPIHSYPNGLRADGSNSPDEPWWDDHARYTILGAPKKISDKEQEPPVMGSRLGWTDVLSALWRVYHPPLPTCEEESGQPAPGSWKIARYNWGDAERTTLPLFWSCPTLAAWVATDITGQTGGTFNPEMLIPADEWEHIEFSEGVSAIVTQHGVGFLSSTNSEGAKRMVDVLERVALESAALFQSCHGYMDDGPLQAERDSILTNPLTAHGRYLEWQTKVEEKRRAITRNQAQTLSAARSQVSRKLASALERWWVGQGFVDLSLDSLDKDQAATSSFRGATIRKRLRLVGALAAGLGTGFILQNLAEAVGQKMTIGTYEWQLKAGIVGTTDEKTIELLTALAAAAETWESIGVVALLVGVAAGGLAFWFAGSQKDD